MLVCVYVCVGGCMVCECVHMHACVECCSGGVCRCGRERMCGWVNEVQVCEHVCQRVGSDSVCPQGAVLCWQMFNRQLSEKTRSPNL